MRRKAKKEEVLIMVTNLKGFVSGEGAYYKVK